MSMYVDHVLIKILSRCFLILSFKDSALCGLKMRYIKQNNFMVVETT